MDTVTLMTVMIMGFPDGFNRLLMGKLCVLSPTSCLIATVCSIRPFFKSKNVCIRNKFDNPIHKVRHHWVEDGGDVLITSGSVQQRANFHHQSGCLLEYATHELVLFPSVHLWVNADLLSLFCYRKQSRVCPKMRHFTFDWPSKEARCPEFAS